MKQFENESHEAAANDEHFLESAFRKWSGNDVIKEVNKKF